MDVDSLFEEIVRLSDAYRDAGNDAERIVIGEKLRQVREAPASGRTDLERLFDQVHRELASRRDGQ